MRDKIEALIAETIRPLIEADGGQIELVSVDEAKVVIRLAGMCSGCPGSTYTTSRIIEPLLKKACGDSLTIQFELGPSF